MVSVQLAPVSSDDLLSSVLLKEENSLLLVSISLREEGERSIEIAPPAFSPPSVIASLDSLSQILANTFSYCILPHEKLSFKATLTYINTDTASVPTLLDLSTYGIGLALLLSGVPMRDTPISSLHTTRGGVSWISRGYFTEKLLGLSLENDAAPEEVKKWVEEKPAAQMACLKTQLSTLLAK
ncbi:hypothetical protein NEDG_01372 [Nematocida displodere]|uniref:Uncharacterized protein n=1 Tax=Nematocida displodere TaxID=1805483 RepID=A0A177EE79_9MICR|nr:hypothetical protein NEDG_01372 [Nematocida displodere]